MAKMASRIYFLCILGLNTEHVRFTKMILQITSSNKRRDFWADLKPHVKLHNQAAIIVARVRRIMLVV